MRCGRRRPRRSAVYYAGAASGGIFKTTDGGTTGNPCSTRSRSQSIGALAVAAIRSEYRLGRDR